MKKQYEAERMRLTGSSKHSGKAQVGALGLGAAGVVLFAQVIVLLVAQGGYFPTVVCLCGAASWITALVIWLRRGRKGEGLPPHECAGQNLPPCCQNESSAVKISHGAADLSPTDSTTKVFDHSAAKSAAPREILTSVPLLLAGVGICCLLGLCLCGFTLSGFAEAASWLAVAGAAMLGSGLSAGQRRRLFDCIAVLGAAYALIGIALAAAGVDGVMRDGRLEMSFQYANGLAAFLAVSFVLGASSPHRWIKVSSVLCVAAFAMAQSGGACLCAALTAAVALAVWAWRQQRVLQSIPAGARAALAIAAIALLSAACIGLVAWLLPERFASAITDFTARGMQVTDGLALLAGSPILGIGPDAWQYTYPFMQTAQYHVAVVHCSWLQVALDSGVLGFACLAGAVAIGVARLMREAREGRATTCWLQLACVLFLALHSLMDFDLQFGLLAVLLALMLSCDFKRSSESATKSASNPDESAVLDATPTKTHSNPDRSGFLQPITFGLCLLLCLAGSAYSIPSYLMTQEASLGKPATALAFYQQTPLLQNDVALQTLYLKIACDSGDYQAAAAFYSAHGVRSDYQALYMYRALCELGDYDAAAQELLDALEAQPYNRPFYREALAAVDKYGFSNSYRSQLRAAYHAFNQRALASRAAGHPHQLRVKF